MIRFRLATLILIAIPAASFATPAADSLFAEGNRAYQEGRFEDAIASYEAVREAGLGSGALYYNLGNAYYRSESYGLAAANYERAKRIMPRDPDLKENMRLLAERTLDGDLAAQRIPPWQLFVTVSRQLTWKEWLIVAEVLYAITLAGLALALTGSRRAGGVRSTIASFGGLTVLVAAFLALAWYEQNGIDRGAVIATEIAGRSGPGSQFTQEFLVHEGTMLRVHRERGAWLLCSLSAEIRGWIPQSAVERI
ncbi:MAG: tetratricopeptide repeat protein [Gemmatimonadetes bacterium]|nr:tetratricopeptide repeat protein [Gemmatimonadota bacterium]